MWRLLPQFDHIVFTFDEDVVNIDEENVFTVLSKCPGHWGNQMATRGAYIAMEIAADIARADMPTWGVVVMHLSWTPIVDAAVNHGLAWGVPIICAPCPAPEPAQLNEGSQGHAPMQPATAAPWAWVANSNHTFLWLIDNEMERRIAWEGMGASSSRYRPLDALRIHEFSFQPPSREMLAEKEDAAIFGSRHNRLKRPDLAAEIMHQLPDGVRCIVTAPQTPTSTSQIKLSNIVKTVADEWYVPCQPTEYRQLLRRAKLSIISSEHEGGLPGGYLEAAEHGCLWIARQKEWAIDVIGPDWPLYWSNTEEAAEKAIYALEHYEELLEEQSRRLTRRWGGTPNMDACIEAVGRRNADFVGAGKIESVHHKMQTGTWDVTYVERSRAGGGTRGFWTVAEALRRMHMPDTEPEPWEKLGDHGRKLVERWS